MEQLPIWPQGNLQNQSFHLDFWRNQHSVAMTALKRIDQGNQVWASAGGTSNLIERRSDFFFCFFDPLRLVVYSVRTPALSAL
jgi:hypothetical protein